MIERFATMQKNCFRVFNVGTGTFEIPSFSGYARLRATMEPKAHCLDKRWIEAMLRCRR
ncbi:hypothetical protein [Achromobacter arsenitoxydans]|uniref:Uncharacterized protein n=1 Tax=Achromobacter arsenitoxydans SY8 TaxID=477184 RepID=H0FB78_9BURK|nr:hypothetical protein [Achromobacter arsenitoxydans]EHK64343.1 hypothetical protein KYC_20174 [Achromobacter arsenitoxydans SY8]